MSSAVQDVANWLYDTLEPDATLRTALGGAGRVFDLPVPQAASTNAPTKFLAFRHMSGLPVVCLGPTYPGEVFLWDVLVYGRSLPYSELEAAAERVETLLANVEQVSAGWRIRVDKSPIDSPTRRGYGLLPGGVVERYLGRQWRIVALATS